MFSFLRRKLVTQPEESTYNDRIQKFWNWFKGVASDFHAAINDHRCDSLTEITSAKMNELFPGLGWCYGPGADGVGHSLTLTGEGIEHQQLLALHWLSLAPIIEGWTFYAARQPGPIKGHVIKIGGLSIDPKEIWVTPKIDEDDEVINLTIWHPLWHQIEKKQQWTIVFLFLDESLGEYGTQWWIGDIRMENDQLSDSFPLEELSEFVAATSKERNWKKNPPGESYTLFNITPSDHLFPRSDLITLATAAPSLLKDHREAEGKMPDPFEGSGADYLYLSIPKAFFPAGAEIEKRSELEEAFDVALRENSSGRCIGGGYGLERGYVDLLIFDGKRSISVIKEVLKSQNFPKGTTLEYFAVEKLKLRIIL